MQNRVITLFAIIYIAIIWTVPNISPAQGVGGAAPTTSDPLSPTAKIIDENKKSEAPKSEVGKSQEDNGSSIRKQLIFRIIQDINLLSASGLDTYFGMTPELKSFTPAEKELILSSVENNDITFKFMGSLMNFLLPGLGSFVQGDYIGGGVFLGSFIGGISLLVGRYYYQLSLPQNTQLYDAVSHGLLWTGVGMIAVSYLVGVFVPLGFKGPKYYKLRNYFINSLAMSITPQFYLSPQRVAGANNTFSEGMFVGAGIQLGF